MLSIGAFSKRCGVSARMLRHYDQIGLLHPAHIAADSRYRYYDEAQLPIVRQIEQLKQYGFLLSEISGLLGLSQAELSGRIHMRRLDAYAELNELRKTLRRMEDQLMEMEETTMKNEKYHMIQMQQPAQRVFGIRRRIHIGEIHDLFQELLSEMEKRGLKRAGATQCLYHGQEFSYESMDVEAQVQVVGEHPDIQIITEQLCVATTHIGPYDTLHFAYEALREWMEVHREFGIAGPAVERYLKDENMVKSPEEMETGVFFPIAPVQK